jgi:plastocyanin
MRIKGVRAFGWAVCAFVLSFAPIAAGANCGCSLDRIAAAGVTMSAEGMRGPCGQLLAATKVATAQSIAPTVQSQSVISAPEAKAAAGSTKDVGIHSSFYDNQFLTVNAGDTVKWTLIDGFHTVTSDTGLFDSNSLFNPGDSFSFTFNTPGAYGYHCIFHGFAGGAMFGTVNVVAAPEPVATTLLLPAALLCLRPRRRRP